MIYHLTHLINSLKLGLLYLIILRISPKNMSKSLQIKLISKLLPLPKWYQVVQSILLPLRENQEEFNFSPTQLAWYPRTPLLRIVNLLKAKLYNQNSDSNQKLHLQSTKVLNKTSKKANSKLIRTRKEG